MKLKKTLMALLLTGTMIIGMGTSAMAEEGEVETPAEGTPTIGTGTIDAPATASIQNHLEFAEGITVPGVTFEYEITKVTKDAPTATIAAVTYTSADAKGTLTDGKYVLHKNSEIKFGTFPHAGKYEYTINQKEEAETEKVAGIGYADEVYTLNVYVANGSENNLYIQSITASENNVKVHSLHFTNTYTKNASLTVEKNVAGDLADQTKDFDFKITFYPAATSTETKFIGKIGNETVEVTSGAEKTFQLHHGESLVFASLPAGTRYKVEEVGALDGYTPSVSVIENGVSTVTNKQESTDGAGLTSEAKGNTSCLAGENENKVSFTNTYNDVALTGVIINNLPFILLIVLGVCALGLLAVAKKRRMTNR